MENKFDTNNKHGDFVNIAMRRTKEFEKKRTMICISTPFLEKTFDVVKKYLPENSVKQYWS